MSKKRKLFSPLFIVPIASLIFSETAALAETSMPLKSIKNPQSQDGYTINFENVSMLELLKFIGKISNNNFIYDPQDLQFTVTFTSTEPTSLENIMTAFSQVLTLHGLMMMEDENNLVIHKNPAVKSLPLLITDKKGIKKTDNPFFVTRIFNIHNANPANLKTILQPMISAAATLTEVKDTRQLIVMDIASNVQKIAELISYLDMPSANLQMKSYKLKNTLPEAVSTILKELITPMSEGNPIILVPQNSTNTLFIVSTPYLNEKSVEILSELDSSVFSDEKTLLSDNVLIYRLKFKSFSNIQKGLNEIIEGAKSQRFSMGEMATVIAKAQYIPTSNSVVFIGEKLTLDKLKSFLEIMDDSGDKRILSENSKFLVYEAKQKTAEDIFQYLGEIERHLVSSHLGDPALITCLENMKMVPSSNSIVFTGTPESIAEVTNLLTGIDRSDFTSIDEFLIYTPVHLSPQTLMESLKQISKKLTVSGLEDINFLRALDDSKFIPSSYAIVFTGSKDTISKIKKMMDDLDALNKRGELEDNLFIYKLKFISKKSLDQTLETFAETLPIDSPIHDIIEQRSFLDQSQSVVFRGSQTSIDKIKQILEVADAQSSSRDHVLMYKIKSLDETQVIDNLDNYVDNLTPQNILYNSMKGYKYLPSSHLIIFKGNEENLKEIETILATVDSTSSSNVFETLNYKVKSLNFQSIVDALTKIQNGLSKKDTLYLILKNAQIITQSRLIIFNGPPTVIADLKDLLAKLEETPPDAIPTEVVYNLKNVSGDLLLKNLTILQNNLKDDLQEFNPSLLKTLQNITWLKDTNSLVIMGTKKDVDQTITFVTQIDSAEQAMQDKLEILNYKVLSSPPQNVYQNLKNYQNTLSKNDPIYQTIDDSTFLQDVKLIVLKGAKSVLAELQDVLNKIDVATPLDPSMASTHEIYTVTHNNGDAIITYLNSIRAKLKKSNSENNSSLVNTLSNIEWFPESQTIYISGPKKDTDQVLGFIKQFDTVSKEKTNLVYKLQNISGDIAISQLKTVAKNINSQSINSDSLLKTIQSIEWIKSSNSLFISGSKPEVDALNTLLLNIDIPAKAIAQANFYTYKALYLSPSDIKSQLSKLINNLSSDSEFHDPSLKKMIDSAQVINSSKSLLFTGSATSIEKVKELIISIDVGEKKSIDTNPHFILYKTLYLQPNQVQDMMLNIANDLEKSGLTDSNLIAAIRSGKIVSATNSITYTGDEQSLTKIKELLGSVDVESALQSKMQKIGPSTVFIYKIKNMDPNRLMDALKSLGVDLSKSNNQESNLAETINSMRYIKENNSIVFTGPEAVLNKVMSLLEKIDIPSAEPHSPVKLPQEYSLYTPQNLDGEDLIQTIKDFENSLKSTGVQDSLLVECIQNLKWMPKTSTIIISGDSATIPKVLKLLERFDVSNSLKDDKLNPDIDTVEDTSFLIYKVQYHYGEAILQAIQGIGEDLKSSTAPSTVALVNAIRSLSFVQVTNSLLSTGDAKALTRLKELIQTIDIPLKQVFIEVLVIETDLESSLEFGLRWATQGNYKGRLQFGAANNNAADTVNQTGINFPAKVNTVVPPTAPAVGDIPVTPGGYLGVIGDLIFHKGKSYITLGDFVNALQSDNNSTVVLNQKIITQDNRQSSLFVGSNVPYNGSVVTNQGQNTTVTTSNIQYLDIGIKLDITPKVGEDNVVTLDISQDISEQTSTSGSSGSSNTQVNGITTKRTSLDTSVHVPNQHFVVLTGQIRNTQARNKYMIPCLGGLPLIGAAFSDSLTAKQSVTVVMFIKPHIVNTYEEYKKITQKQENVYRDIGVAEDFDEGVELVRDPDDY